MCTWNAVERATMREKGGRRERNQEWKGDGFAKEEGRRGIEKGGRRERKGLRGRRDGKQR